MTAAHSELAARLRARISIETACGNRTDNPTNHVRLMDEAAAEITRLQLALSEARGKAIRWDRREAMESFETIRRQISTGNGMIEGTGIMRVELSNLKAVTEIAAVLAEPVIEALLANPEPTQGVGE